MLNKKILTIIAIAFICTTNANNEKILALEQKSEEMHLRHDENGFALHKEGEAPIKIQRAFMDKELRGISKDKLNRLIKAGAYLQLNKMENCDDYSMRLKGRLDGGGLFGATVGAFLGKAAVSVVGHGSIYLVSTAVGIFCPPAGVAVGIALESTCGPAIEAASMAVAVAGGVALGAATGPV